jgi:hypothetical protein
LPTARSIGLSGDQIIGSLGMADAGVAPTQDHAIG